MREAWWMRKGLGRRAGMRSFRASCARVMKGSQGGLPVREWHRLLYGCRVERSSAGPEWEL